MKHVIIPHQEWALRDFTQLVWRLEEFGIQYYYGASWINATRGSFPTHTFVLGLIDQLLLELSGHYFVADKRAPVEGYVLGTIPLTLGPPNASTYSMDIDILGDHEELSQYQGRPQGLFERLYHLYSTLPTSIIFAKVTTSIENLIRLVIADVFIRIEEGEYGAAYQPPCVICPAAKLYKVRRVQDVSVDARLVIGADVVWVPVAPSDSNIHKVLDTIFGFDEIVSEKPETPWKVTYRSMDVNDLNDAQISKALALNKGVIHSVYEENGQVHVVMFDDLNHPYVWREFKVDRLVGGNWYPAHEHSEYLKLIKSKCK